MILGEFVVNLRFRQIFQRNYIEFFRKLGDISIEGGFREFESFHAYKSGLEIIPQVLRTWIERQRIEIKPGRFFVFVFIRMRDSEVDPHSHVIWFQFQCFVIGLNGFPRFPQMGIGGS